MIIYENVTKKYNDVTVVDNGDITDGCSFGNMGYISPSHFINSTVVFECFSIKLLTSTFNSGSIDIGSIATTSAPHSNYFIGLDTTISAA